MELELQNISNGSLYISIVRTNNNHTLFDIILPSEGDYMRSLSVKENVNVKWTISVDNLPKLYMETYHIYVIFEMNVIIPLTTKRLYYCYEYRPFFIDQ